jgi:hypothetical protein
LSSVDGKLFSKERKAKRDVFSSRDISYPPLSLSLPFCLNDHFRPEQRHTNRE